MKNKILIIEDEDAIRDNLIELLEIHGFESLGAENGQSGIETAKRFQPDLIICDLMMPQLNGYEVLQNLRQDTQMATIPFIFLTARSERFDIRQGMDLGADDYLIKPCLPQELLRAINTRLSRQSTLKSYYNLAIQRAEDQLQKALYYDTLTSLPNRLLLRDRFGEILQVLKSKYPQESLSIPIIFLGLDRFNRINETLGHRYGDRLLQTVAERLKVQVDPGDILARLSDDQFILIPGRILSRFEVTQFAKAVLTNISQPFTIDSQEIFLTTSIGIVFYNQEAQELDKLLQFAFRAMVLAKQLGGNQYKFYNQSDEIENTESLALEVGLRYAIERQELEVYYQPQINLRTGKIVGAEALVRWRHPERGLISPGKFIPIAEETGLIVPLGEWVLKTACQQVKQWQTIGFENLRIAVNLSARQFAETNIAQTLSQTLSKLQFNPENLELELTESVIIKNPDTALQTLKALRDLGVKIALDDFGTGYSSLSYLQRFPFDVLKIDRSFIHQSATDLKNQTLAIAIIEMAHQLKFKVIAEGVETAAELEFLQQHDCDEMQGYFFSPPVPSQAFQDLLSLGQSLSCRR